MSSGARLWYFFSSRYFQAVKWTNLNTYIHTYVHACMYIRTYIRNMLLVYLLYVLYIGMFMCHRRALVSQFHMKQADNKKLVWPNGPHMGAHEQAPLQLNRLICIL